MPACGDGFAQGSLGETCDLGVGNSNTGECTLMCKSAACGDGLVWANNEQCDNGAMNADNAACKSNCTLNVCGDGFAGPGEACDDGNQNNNDACTNVCKQATCGDGFVQPGEACDLGMNNNNTGACTLACKLPACGDGFLQMGAGEVCDDANLVNTDACVQCKAAKCGDGFVQAGVDECDDGNNTSNDGCSATCKLEFRRAFVSSMLYTGALGGIVGADAKCQARAQAAGLPGTFLAWISDDVNTPQTRFTKGVAGYRLVNNTVIATSFADLTDGTLLAPINVNEMGGGPPVGNTSCAGGGFPTVWTGTLATGNIWVNNQCNQWTSINGTSATWGRATDTNTSWSSWCSGGGAVCVWTSALYCFQQ